MSEVLENKNRMTYGFGMTQTSTPISGSLEDDAPVRIRGSLRMLLLTLLPANISIFVIWGAVPGLLLALQVAALDDANKIGNLAVVATVGAFCAMIAQPVAGLVSDRTRSRFGRRTPWMVGGTLIGGVALIILGIQSTIVGITVCWGIVQIAYNFAQGPLSAILPDRVPRRARGTFAAAHGMGMMTGMLGGQFVGSAFRDAIPVGYAAMAITAVIVVTLFCVINRETSNREQPRETFSIRDFLSTFWVNPIAHPDFFWAFTGRLLLTLGYAVVSGYQLYILADHVGLGLDQAAAYAPLLAGASLLPLLISTVIAGPLSDRLNRRRLFVFIAGAILAVALVAPWVMPNLTGMFIYAILAGVGFGLFQSVDTALITEVLPSQESYAKDLGVVNIAATLPQTLAAGIAGVIVMTAGFAALFPVGIALCVLGALAVWPIRSVR